MGKDYRVPTSGDQHLRNRLRDLQDQHTKLKARLRSPTMPIYDPSFPADAVDGQIAMQGGKPYFFWAGTWTQIGSGGGGELEALWWGVNPPLAVGPQGGVWTVPFIAGVSKTWNIAHAKFRLENPSTAGGYTIKIQRSAAGGVFAPTDIVTLALAAGAFEIVSTGPFGIVSVTSGDLLRVNWTILGANAQNFTIQLEGDPV